MAESKRVRPQHVALLVVAPDQDRAQPTLARTLERHGEQRAGGISRPHHVRSRQLGEVGAGPATGGSEVRAERSICRACTRKSSSGYGAARHTASGMDVAGSTTPRRSRPTTAPARRFRDGERSAPAPVCAETVREQRAAEPGEPVPAPSDRAVASGKACAGSSRRRSRAAHHPRPAPPGRPIRERDELA